jgi:curved DNA-binding protein CbpA
MPAKDYYAILGVQPDSTPAGIRAAYREAVLRTHPDHAGPDAATEFQDVVQAYSVLSDPERRREYDRELETKPPLRVSPRPRPSQAVSRSRQPGVEIEVLLTREEAVRGGKVRVDIPLRRRMRPLYVRIPQVLRAGITSSINFEPMMMEGLLVKICFKVVENHL